MAFNSRLESYKLSRDEALFVGRWGNFLGTVRSHPVQSVTSLSLIALVLRALRVPCVHRVSDPHERLA